MRLLVLVLCAALAACAPVAKSPEALNKTASGKATLTQMNASFLYLAAQNALKEGKVNEAIAFLTALVQKDDKAVNPRLQLAELLLMRGNSKQAIEHIETVLAQGNFDESRRPAISLLHARALATAGKKNEAIPELEKVLLAHPKHFAARLLLIRLYMGTGKMDAAHESVRQGIAEEDTLALRQLQAQLYIRDGKPQKAWDTYEAMRKMAPDDETPVMMLHDLANNMGDAAAAEKVLRDFLSGHADALRITAMLGRLLAGQKRLDEAIAVYESLAEKTHGDADILTSLGLLHYQKNDYEQAEALFRESLKTRPNAAIRFYLAAALDAGGKDKEASELYEQVDAKDPSYIEAQLRLAGMAFEQDKLKEAAERLKALIAQQPDAANAYSMLSAVRLAQEEYRLAIEETQAAMQIEKPPVRLLFNRAAAFESLKEYTMAEKALKRLLETDPEYVDGLNFLGYLYAEMGINLDEAEDMIRRALKQKPDDGYYLDSLAWVYFKRGDYAEAMATQNRAVKQAGDDPIMHDHLGDILWKNNKPDEARQAWQRAIGFKHKEPERLQRKISEGL